MNIKSFCPFVNGNCRDDCVFKYHNVANDPTAEIRNCLIAIKLSDINGMQSDQLNDIENLIKNQNPK